MIEKKAHVTKSLIGEFAFSDKGGLLFYKLYEKDPNKIVPKLRKKITKGFLNKLKGFSIEHDGKAKTIMRKRLRDYAISLGFVRNEKELNEFLTELGIAITKSRMKTIISRDKLVIQASNALDDLNRVINLLIERLRGWYSLHYPELNMKTLSFIKDIMDYGKRENFPSFQNRIKESTGVELTEEDEQEFKEFASMIESMINQRRRLENYIKESMHVIAPNFSSLIDPLLGAKLLAMAGSLEKLAKMPASTIQLLGAEKALFRHLRSKKKKRERSPKYGLIFLSSLIQNVPKEKQGKVARLLAAKLMLAARIDFYSNRDESAKLKKELQNEIEKTRR